MMHWIYRITVLLVCLTSLSLYGESDYLLCIEGGGSKTILQVMNQEGQILSLMKNGVNHTKIETSGSNINLIGPEGVRQVLRSLFDEVFLLEGNREIDLKSLIPTSHIIAGMAGTGLPQNKQSIISLIQERGISSDRVLVMSDAEMALQLINGEGIILIAGTGSICLGKRDDTLFRVGGLGRILGDEGSGYQIGLQALKAALAEEYGWGISTNLTPALKELFQVSDLKTLIPKINLGEITPSKIASSAPIVFSKAAEQDEVAKEIIDRAAGDLSYLLTTMINISLLSDCEIHLWGGIFKNVHSEDFIQKVREKLPEAYRNLRMINKSQDNLAILFAIRNFALTS
jgi:N-acetylglucosamine kinase-like BadF-type ATPase